ncbi:MAG TPA: hypothetical protein VMY37_28625 [Thermoguttaceae bacterium]|nr:hypothetical protein [Thermoguttaceae bacterium]
MDRNQLELYGTVDHIGLDFYHWSEHVHTARRKAFREDDAEGSAWATDSLHRVKREGHSSARQTAVDRRSKATPPAVPRWIDSWAACPNAAR